jgi:cystathionine gamma-synthase
MPPLHLSSNFRFPEFGRPGAYDYTRSGNPTRRDLERTLAHLEQGAAAVCTPSGMAAVTLVSNWIGPRARVLAPFDCYGGTHRLLTTLAARGQIEVRFVDFTQGGEDAIDEFRPRLVWLETPSNPLLRITDVRRVVTRARQVGAKTVVDNTFLTPVGQRPLLLGADVVVHSTTKAINGHSDVVAGAVVAKDAEDAERLAWEANCFGLCQSPFDAYLTLRGLRTLHVRLRQMEASAAALAARLADHPAVRRVHYPGLPSHPGHAIARAQQDGFGFVLSFEVADRSAARRLVEGLRLFTLAESLGGVESLVCHPPTMTHAAMDEDARLAAGIGEGLLRLSIGCEAESDLWADLEQGLRAAAEPEAAVNRPSPTPPAERESEATTARAPAS